MFGATFGSWDVQQVHGVVARSTVATQKLSKFKSHALVAIPRMVRNMLFGGASDLVRWGDHVVRWCGVRVQWCGAMVRCNDTIIRYKDTMVRCNGAMVRCNGAMVRCNGAVQWCDGAVQWYISTDLYPTTVPGYQSTVPLHRGPLHHFLLAKKRFLSAKTEVLVAKKRVLAAIFSVQCDGCTGVHWCNKLVQWCIAPHRRTIAPHRRTIAPHRRTIAPYRRLIAPYHRTIAPHRRTIAPYHRTIAPYHRTIAPHRRTVAPYHRTTHAPWHRTTVPHTSYHCTLSSHLPLHHWTPHNVKHCKKALVSWLLDLDNSKVLKIEGFGVFRTTFWSYSVVLRGRRKGLGILPKVSKTWGFCGSFKNVGRRGTLEEDLGPGHQTWYPFPCCQSTWFVPFKFHIDAFAQDELGLKPNSSITRSDSRGWVIKCGLAVLRQELHGGTCGNTWRRPQDSVGRRLCQ